MNGISTLGESLQSAPQPLLACEDMRRGTQERALTWPCWHPLKLWGNNFFCCLQASQSGVFCYNSQKDQNTFQAAKIRGKLNPQTFVKIFYGTQLIFRETGKKVQLKNDSILEFWIWMALPKALISTVIFTSSLGYFLKVKYWFLKKPRNSNCFLTLPKHATPSRVLWAQQQGRQASRGYVARVWGRGFSHFRHLKGTQTYKGSCV